PTRQTSSSRLKSLMRFPEEGFDSLRGVAVCRPRTGPRVPQYERWNVGNRIIKARFVHAFRKVVRKSCRRAGAAAGKQTRSAPTGTAKTARSFSKICDVLPAKYGIKGRSFKTESR